MESLGLITNAVVFMDHRGLVGLVPVQSVV